MRFTDLYLSFVLVITFISLVSLMMGFCESIRGLLGVQLIIIINKNGYDQLIKRLQVFILKLRILVHEQLWLKSHTPSQY